jgi:hypothetical protein
MFRGPKILHSDQSLGESLDLSSDRFASSFLFPPGKQAFIQTPERGLCLALKGQTREYRRDGYGTVHASYYSDSELHMRERL